MVDRRIIGPVVDFNGAKLSVIFLLLWILDEIPVLLDWEHRVIRYLSIRGSELRMEPGVVGTVWIVIV